MSNDYFTAPVLLPYTVARASQINDFSAAVEAAFDKLPDPDEVKFNSDSYAVTTGTSSSYAATLPSAPTAYFAGLRCLLRFHVGNVGPVVLNLNGLGPVPVLRNSGANLSANDLPANGVQELVYVGPHFAVIGIPGPQGARGLPGIRLDVFSDTEFRDSFSAYSTGAELQQVWNVSRGVEVCSFPERFDSPGGKALYAGLSPSPTGNFVIMQPVAAMPFDPDAVYGVEWDVEAGAGDIGTEGLNYFGFSMEDKDGINLNLSVGTYIYSALGGIRPTVGRFRFRGYIGGSKNRAINTATVQNNSKLYPTTPPVGAVWVRPVALLNFWANPTPPSDSRITLHSVRMWQVDTGADLWEIPVTTGVSAELIAVIEPGEEVSLHARLEGAVTGGTVQISLPIEWSVAGNGLWSSVGASTTQSRSTDGPLQVDGWGRVQNTQSVPIRALFRATGVKTGAGTFTTDVARSFLRAR